MLQLENISVGYKMPIIREIKLRMGHGELAVLIGKNGSGKTTLLKTIAGFIKPLAGRVLFKGQDLASIKVQKRASFRSLVPQTMSPEWAWTVREMVAQGLFHKHGLFGPETLADRVAIEAALEAAKLRELAERRVTELSGGEFQRVVLARAAVQGSDLLLLDEPVNNLDPKWTLLTMDYIRELVSKGASAIISLHNLQLASVYAERAFVIKAETFCEVQPRELLGTAFMDEVFGFVSK